MLLLSIASSAFVASTQQWCIVCESGNDLQSAFESAWSSRRPLLARGCVDVSWMSEDLVNEIAGLSLESDVISRLVTDGGSKVEHGPLSDDELSSLPDADWTLLVNDLETLCPRVARAADEIYSVGPLSRSGWIRDDVMMSVAARGGGVGPHVDSNDVVLLQTSGTRRWSLEKSEVNKKEAEARRDESKMANCLEDFRCDASFDLNPGDFLYVPARIPHLGVSQTSEPLCATLSLGFRSLSRVDLATRWIDTQAFWDDEENDNVLAGLLNDDPRSLPSSSLDAAKAAIMDAIDKKLDDTLPTLLGELITAPRPSSSEPTDENGDDAWNELLAEDLSAVLLADENVEKADFFHRAAGTKFAYFETREGVLIFVDGKASPLLSLELKPLAVLLASSSRIDAKELLHQKQIEGGAEIVDLLLEQGHLVALQSDQRSR